jgi:hypothetical protein
MKTNKLKEFITKMFKDENDINEKSIVGFASFIMMSLTLMVDLVTGYLGREMPIHEFVFNGFLWITLGSFGIASVDKWITTNKKSDTTTEITE